LSEFRVNSQGGKKQKKIEGGGRKSDNTAGGEYLSEKGKRPSFFKDHHLGKDYAEMVGGEVTTPLSLKQNKG